MERTKFNVNKNTEKRTFGDIVFDSVLEMRYYAEVVIPGIESGEITKCERQKKYILQDGFEHNGEKIRPIIYAADFYLEYADGHSTVIDIKGCPDATAILKRKMFWFRYPDTDYQWISYIKKFGGWGSYDEYQKMRKAAKRAAKKDEG